MGGNSFVAAFWSGTKYYRDIKLYANVRLFFYSLDFIDKFWYNCIVKKKLEEVGYENENVYNGRKVDF